MAKVTLKNVYKIYPGDKGKEVTAVEDFNLDIADREFVVFVGPSGCGKSTTLRMIAGLEEISKGDVFIGEKRVNDVPPKDRDIAMVFQNYALYPHMSVYENMAFGLKLRKYPKAEIDKRVKEAAAILGIEQYLERKPKALSGGQRMGPLRDRIAGLRMGLEDRLDNAIGSLSGGQRQALTLLMASWLKPNLLLLDEHTAALDPKSAEQVITLTNEVVNRDKLTTLMVTHSMQQAVNLGDRIVMMNRGQVLHDFRGAEKKRLRPEDLIDRFNEVRAREQLDESAAAMLRENYI